MIPDSKTSNIGKETAGNYGLFAMQEFENYELFGIGFGDLVEKNSGIVNKETKTYRFKDVTCVHEDAFMGLHL